MKLVLTLIRESVESETVALTKRLETNPAMNATRTNFTLARRVVIAGLPTSPHVKAVATKNALPGSPGTGVFSCHHPSPAPHRWLREWIPVRLPVRFRTAVTRGGAFFDGGER